MYVLDPTPKTAKLGHLERKKVEDLVRARRKTLTSEKKTRPKMMKKPTRPKMMKKPRQSAFLKCTRMEKSLTSR